MPAGSLHLSHLCLGSALKCQTRANPSYRAFQVMSRTDYEVSQHYERPLQSIGPVTLGQEFEQKFRVYIEVLERGKGPQASAEPVFQLERANQCIRTFCK